MTDISPLREFVQSMTHLVEQESDEQRLMDRASKHLSALIARDDWLPDAFAQPDPRHYQQYLLYCDPLERFCVVSFVWGPGQTTPVHDHTVWGLVGLLRGSERCQEYAQGDGCMRMTGEHEIGPGAIDRVSPRIGDIHKVSNALSDRASISIHVYGGNIGATHRHVYDVETGAVRDFVSGYTDAPLPNLWR